MKPGSIIRIDGNRYVEPIFHGHFDGTNCCEYECPVCHESTISSVPVICMCNGWWRRAPTKPLTGGGYTFVPH